MEWTREKTLLLIEEYNNRPGLWDMSNEDYRKKDIKKELLEEVVEKFDRLIPAKDIEKKFHTLRTQYHREISRMNASCGAEPYKSKWFAFNYLEFLSTPNACRSKDPRRRSKVLYIPEIKSETPTIHNVQVTVTDKSGVETRKDLRVLFENDDDEKNDDEEEDDQEATEEVQQVIRTEIHCVPEMRERYRRKCTSSGTAETNTSYEDEHFVEEQQHEPEPDTEEVHYTTPNADSSKFIKASMLPNNALLKRGNHEIYGEILYETASQHSQVTVSPSTPAQSAKKFCKDQASNAMFLASPPRDECSTFGECVANELRFITDRQILIRAKHKINTALFEANVAQLEKNG